MIIADVAGCVSRKCGSLKKTWLSGLSSICETDLAAHLACSGNALHLTFSIQLARSLASVSEAEHTAIMDKT